MNFLKKVSMKHLWIYIGAAFVFKLILSNVLHQPLVDGSKAFYMALPMALQKLLYPVSDSLARLNPTELELSILFAVGAVEKLLMLIELSIISAFLLLAYKWVSKKRTKSEKLV